MGHQFWPLFDLRIRTERLEIRLPTDDDLFVLAQLASDGVHDPATMPFLIPWTDQPSPLLEQGLLQWGWRHRATWTPDDWAMNGAVSYDGELIGIQDVSGKDFSANRIVKTGSWLGKKHHGKGFGKEMRRAVLHFAFAGLGAKEAHSGGFVDNAPSLRVSSALGYEETGRYIVERRGVPVETLELSLTRAQWEASERIDVTIEGLDDCRSFFVQ